jgi:alpha-tubulin suppressor-like RCC1 family protein
MAGRSSLPCLIAALVAGVGSFSACGRDWDMLDKVPPAQDASAGGSAGGAGTNAGGAGHDGGNLDDASAGAGGSGVGGGAGIGGQGGGNAGAGGAGGQAGTGGVAGQGGAGPTCVKQVVCGYQHTCAIRADKTLWCWGANGSGQVGINSTDSPQTTPKYVSKLGAAVEHVALGVDDTCARTSDGSGWCWGGNGNGKLGLGLGPNTPQPDPTKLTALTTPVVQFALAPLHTCARLSDQTVWCWGFGYYCLMGQTDYLPPTKSVNLSPASFVAAGDGSTCVIQSDGKAHCVVSGPNLSVVPGLGVPVAEVSMGEEFAVARKNDGSAWAWGSNIYGQLAQQQLGSGSTSATQVAAISGSVAQVVAGKGHACARTQEGRLYCWGMATYGQLGDGTTTGVACGSTDKCKTTPVQVTALGTSVYHACAGQFHTCAVDAASKVWCWGGNGDGQLGDGTTDWPKPTPQPVNIPCP